MNIPPGTTAGATLTVTPDRTADSMGNPGAQVLATPWVIALLENAAAAVLRPHLEPGQGTVGTMVEMRHLAATPLGMTARATATLLESDGRRFLFAVEAWDERDKIAEGRHERYLVTDMAKFMERAAKKGRG
jgi:fluoroacetyl-CoA thioesterase